MLPEVVENKQVISAKQMQTASHVLMVLPRAKKLDAAEKTPHLDLLRAALKRKRLQADELAKAPIATDLPQGGAAAWLMLDESATRFEQYTA